MLRDLTPIEREIENANHEWLLMRVRPYRTIDDRIDGVVLTFVDVTPLHCAQGALRDIDQRFRALMHATSEVFYQMNPTGPSCGSSTAVVSCATRRAPLRLADEYIPSDEQPLVMRAIDEAIRTKSVFQLEHRVWRADGTLGWTSSRAVPLLDERGDISSGSAPRAT